MPITTRGDTTPGSLAALGGKGLFTAELEAGLLDGSLDLAVHSLKDLPVRLPDGLVVAAHPPRADPRDALLCEQAATIDDLPRGARVLTGSLRRRAQLLRHRADLVVEDIRGNVDTRIRKWRELGAEGLVLAAAGLERLGLSSEAVSAHPLDAEVMIPAPGQGILALETRADSRAFELCSRARRSRDLARRARRAQRGGGLRRRLHAAARGVGSRRRATASRSRSSWPRATAARFLETTASGVDPDAVAAAAVERLRELGADALLAADSP